MFKPLVTIGAALVVGSFLAAPSLAQDWHADPTYGSTHILVPDPYLVQVTAGGPIDVSTTLGGGCRGYVAEAPDFNIYYQAGGSLPLAIWVGSVGDTTLVVNTPDGRWYCDDDSGEGLNPALVFDYPSSGVYNIWVGTYSNRMAPAVLTISEVRAR